MASVLAVGTALVRWPEIPAADTTSQTRYILSLLDAIEAADRERATPLRRAAPVFPADHGVHLGEAMETWQFAGRAAAEDGRSFGFRLNVYRLRLVPADAPPRPSAWATRHVYWAQLAVTDVRGKQFEFFERYSRDGPSLAGMHGSPHRISVEDWSVELPHGPTGKSRFRLLASEDAVRLDLTLEPDAAGLPVRENQALEDGARSPFHGYRLARMRVRGALGVNAVGHEVTGVAWLEHAWGDIPLPVGQVVWNRFILQLGDGTEVAVLELRRRDGSRAPQASLVLVGPTGETRSVANHELTLEALDEWRSPTDGTSYPSGWRLQVPSADLDLDIRPTLADQEVVGALRYWSGKVEATGRRHGQPVDGWGDVDLFGYASSGAD